jgi:hypothetical protein
VSEPLRDVGALFGDTIAIIRANLLLVVLAFTVMTAIGVAGDLAWWNASAVNLLTYPVMLLLQYEVTLAALAGSGLATRQGRRRFWALVGMSIVSGLGILLGLVLLIVPGLYLYVRWSLATPILIAEGAGPIASLTRSGEEISGRFWPVAGLFLLVGLLWVGAAAVAGVFPEHWLLSSLGTNAALNWAQVTAWCGAVAVYRDGRRTNLAEVFA